MARNYVRPALNVYQIVDDTVTTPGDHLATCVVGANYELYRYGHEELAPVAYSMTEEYHFSGLEQSKPGFDYSLDTTEGNISIYGENMEAQIMGRLGANGCFSGYYTGFSSTELNGCYKGKVRTSEDPFVLQTDRALAYAAGYEGSGHLDPALQGYPVEIGDKVYIASDATSKEVRALIAPVEARVHDGYSGFAGFTNADAATTDFVRLSYVGPEDTTANGWAYQDQRLEVRVSDVTYGATMNVMTQVVLEISDITDSSFIAKHYSGYSGTGVKVEDGKAYVTFSNSQGNYYSGAGEDAIAITALPGSKIGDDQADLVVSLKHKAADNSTLVKDPSDPNNNDSFVFDVVPHHYEADASDVIEANVINLIGADEPSSLQAGPVQVLEGYSGYCQIGNSYEAEAEYVRITGAGKDGDKVAEGSSYYNSAYSTIFLVKAVEATYSTAATGGTASPTPTPYLTSVKFEVIDTTGRIPVKTVSYSSAADIKSGTAKEIDSAYYPGLKFEFKHDPANTGGAYNLPYVLVCQTAGFKDEFAFYYEPKHQSTTKFTGVRCDAPLCTVEEMNRQADITSNFVITKPVDAELENYTLHQYGVDEPYITLKHNVIDLPGREDVPFTENKGDVYISYRVRVVPPAEEDIFDVSDIYDIQEAFGVIDPDNDLAYGCYCSMKGAAGKTIYALRTRGESKEDFLSAISKTEANDNLYNFVPMSNDVAVMDAVFTYNMSQSTPERKHWRENFFGPQAVSDYEVARKDSEGHAILASIVKVGGKSIVVLDRGVKLNFTAIPLNGTPVSMYPGDEIEILAEQGYGRYVINKVNKTTLELVEGPATSYGLTSISLWKTDTAKNAAEYVESVADNFSDRRAVVVWADNAMNADGVIDNKYLAATVAGMSSSFLPQAPMTRAEVPTVTSAQRMYTRYTQRELDEIAKHGVMIITQDTKGGPCYVRHQLTTEMDRGILHQELSITRNLDNISYAVVDALEVYIGRSNVTDSAIDALYARMLTLLNQFSTNSTDPKIGPSLGKWESLQVYQDPTFLTRVIIKVKLYLPVPMNNIDVYELAFAYDSVSGYTEITTAAAI